MAVGIDIGTKSIKIVELAKSGDKYSLKGSGVIGYTGPTVENMKDDSAVIAMSDVIRKLHKEAKISSKDVMIALPEQHVSTRIIRFPLLTDQEIASAVKWESEQYIPIPVAEAVVQHTIIERNETANPPFTRVLLVAAPKEIVSIYVQIVKTAGLNAEAVETDLMALSRSIAPATGTHMVLDMGAFTSDLAIVKDGHLVFTRSLATGGDALTRSIAQGLGMDIAQAEQYKKTYGLSSDKLEGKIQHALSPVINMIAEEIKKAIHFYQSEDKGEQPQSVVLSGGSSGLIGIVPALTEELNKEVVIGDPFAKVDMQENIRQSLASYAPLYAIAVGVAMRDK